MTQPQLDLFLEEYQTLCEKYKLHLVVDLDIIIIEDCTYPSDTQEDKEHLLRYAYFHLEPEIPKPAAGDQK